MVLTEHKLTSIDEVNRKAICSQCGEVGISIRNSKRQGKGRYRCRISWNKWRNQRNFPYTKHKGDICERCGFVPENRCQLDVHHIDGDNTNNEPSNLITLCSNCHRLQLVKLLEFPPYDEIKSLQKDLQRIN